MPRKREREKRLKFDGVRLSTDAERKQERKRAMIALKKAKAIEAERLQSGWRYVQQDKHTRKLIQQ